MLDVSNYNAINIADQINVELGRRAVLDFTQYTMPTYEANWHHILICEYLDKFAKGEIKKLLVLLLIEFFIKTPCLNV